MAVSADPRTARPKPTAQTKNGLFLVHNSTVFGPVPEDWLEEQVRRGTFARFPIKVATSDGTLHDINGVSELLSKRAPSAIRPDLEAVPFHDYTKAMPKFNAVTTGEKSGTLEYRKATLLSLYASTFDSVGSFAEVIIQSRIMSRHASAINVALATDTLASISPVFSDLARASMVKQNVVNDMIHVQYQCISPLAVKHLIEFILHGPEEAPREPKILILMFQEAQKLRCPTASDKILAFLKDTVDLEPQVEVARFAEFLKQTDLVNIMVSKLVHRGVELIDRDVCLALGPEAMRQLVDSTELSIPEDLILELVNNWVNSNESSSVSLIIHQPQPSHQPLDDRHGAVRQLYEAVRFSLLSPKMLQTKRRPELDSLMLTGLFVWLDGERPHRCWPWHPNHWYEVLKEDQDSSFPVGLRMRKLASGDTPWTMGTLRVMSFFTFRIRIIDNHAGRMMIGIIFANSADPNAVAYIFDTRENAFFKAHVATAQNGTILSLTAAGASHVKREGSWPHRVGGGDVLEVTLDLSSNLFLTMRVKLNESVSATLHAVFNVDEALEFFGEQCQSAPWLSLNSLGDSIAIC